MAIGPGPIASDRFRVAPSDGVRPRWPKRAARSCRAILASLAICVGSAGCEVCDSLLIVGHRTGGSRTMKSLGGEKG